MIDIMVYLDNQKSSESYYILLVFFYFGFCVQTNIDLPIKVVS